MKQVLLIANPDAGGKAQELQTILDTLDDGGVVYDLIAITPQTQLVAEVQARQLDSYAAAIVYGGDGTVSQVAHALHDQRLPLLVLPGGTANVIARGIGVTSSIASTVRAFVDGRYRTVAIDLVYYGNKPMFLDMHAGLLAETIQNSDHQLKKHLGVVAYVVQSVRQLARAEFFDYELSLDGKRLRGRATICNFVNIGPPDFLGLPLFSRRYLVDGEVMVAICHTKNVALLLWWAVRRVLFRLDTPRAIAVHHAKEVVIHRMPSKMQIDDVLMDVRFPLTLQVKQAIFPVIVPLPHTWRAQLQNGWLALRTEYYRFRDHYERSRAGLPYNHLSQVSDNLFIGGQPGRRGTRLFKDRGITAVVSLRMSKPRHIPSGVEVLHLPTPDHTAISLADLQKGVDFMRRQTDGGGKVYVHCHLGEGRAATMLAAYLVSEGMFLNEALATIKRSRIFIRPNRRQRARLREFARQLKKGARVPEGTVLSAKKKQK